MFSAQRSCGSSGRKVPNLNIVAFYLVLGRNGRQISNATANCCWGFYLQILRHFVKLANIISHLFSSNTFSWVQILCQLANFYSIMIVFYLFGVGRQTDVFYLARLIANEVTLLCIIELHNVHYWLLSTDSSSVSYYFTLALVNLSSVKSNINNSISVSISQRNPLTRDYSRLMMGFGTFRIVSNGYCTSSDKSESLRTWFEA